MAGGAAAGQQQFHFLSQNYTTKNSFFYKILTFPDLQYIHRHIYSCADKWMEVVHSYIPLWNMQISEMWSSKHQDTLA